MTDHADELKGLIGLAINAAPRSQQKRIGPSEIGTPCERKLAYKLLGVPETDLRGPAWRPTVGTAVHAWLDHQFQRLNQLYGGDRFYTERRVQAGWIVDPTRPEGGYWLEGTCDLFDRHKRSTVDWKIVGPTKIKEVKRGKDPDEQYIVQAHTYGLGYEQAGETVEHVAVMYLPSNGELSDGHMWSAPYDRDIALTAIRRASQMHRRIAEIGDQVLLEAEAVDDRCQYCPFFQPGSEDVLSACPGAEGRAVRRDALFDML